MLSTFRIHSGQKSIGQLTIVKGIRSNQNYTQKTAFLVCRIIPLEKSCSTYINIRSNCSIRSDARGYDNSVYSFTWREVRITSYTKTCLNLGQIR